MSSKANGRLALIVAAGLLAFASAPLHAAGDDAAQAAPDQAAAVGTATDTSVEPAKAIRHRGTKKVAAKTRKPDRAAAKKTEPSDIKAAAGESKTADGVAANQPASMPAAVANANAQWPAETTTNTYNMSSQASSVLSQIGGQPQKPADKPAETSATASPDSAAGNTQVVASDQLNDLDRAITDDKQPALTLAKATIDAPVTKASTDAPVQEQVSNDNSTWDQTSLIGKIFIAFGGLLTMASAVRMFIA